MDLLPGLRAHFSGCCFIILVLFCLVSLASAQQPAAGNEFDDLKQRLIKDGFAPEKIQAILAKDSVSFTPDGVSLFFIHSESSLNYDQFLSKDSIANAFKYMADHKEPLDSAQKAFGVDKTVITAILLVETRLGNYLGNQTVINTLATMASLTDETLRNRIWNAIPDQKKPKKETFLKKWACDPNGDTKNSRR